MTYEAALGYQPSRRLDAEWNQDQEDHWWDHLHPDRYHQADLLSLGAEGIAHAGAPDGTDVDEHLNVAGEEASKGGGGKLRLVGGDGVFNQSHGHVG
jgi:hypothetical protein